MRKRLLTCWHGVDRPPSPSDSIKALEDSLAILPGARKLVNSLESRAQKAGRKEVGQLLGKNGSNQRVAQGIIARAHGAERAIWHLLVPGEKFACNSGRSMLGDSGELTSICEILRQ